MSIVCVIYVFSWYKTETYTYQNDKSLVENVKTVIVMRGIIGRSLFICLPYLQTQREFRHWNVMQSKDLFPFFRFLKRDKKRKRTLYYVYKHTKRENQHLWYRHKWRANWGIVNIVKPLCLISMCRIPACLDYRKHNAPKQM